MECSHVSDKTWERLRLFFASLRLCARFSSGDKSLLPLQTGAEVAGAARVAELLQRLRLDLADALARHAEMPPHLFQRLLAAILQPKAHHQDFALARGEVVQRVVDLLAQNQVRGGLG